MKKDWFIPAAGVLAVILIAVVVWLSFPSAPPPVHRGAPTPISQTTCAFNGVQTLTVGGSGTYTLSLAVGQTGSIALTDTASTIQTDIGGLTALLSNGTTGVVGSNVTVTGSTGGPFTIRFFGSIADSAASVGKLITAGTATTSVSIVPTDQTNQFQKLVNSYTGPVLNLAANSCWEIDGDLPAGTTSGILAGSLNATMFTAAGVLSGAGLTSGTAYTALPVTTSGSVTIPNGSNVFLQQTVGSAVHFQTFVTTGGSISPGAISIPVNSLAANFSYTSAATITWATSVTSLPVNTSGYATITNGESVQVQDLNSAATQTFTANGSTSAGSTSITVNSAIPNYPYLSGAGNSVVSPVISAIPITGSAWDIPTGTTIRVAQATAQPATESFTSSGDTPAGMTSIAVSGSHFANYHYAVGSTVNTVNGVHIHNNTDLTVNGNGASLVQTACQPGDTLGDQPILFMTQDTGLTVENLTLTGAYQWPGAGCNGAGDHGPGTEKAAGYYSEDETNQTITHIGVFNTQGDLAVYQQPVDFGIGTGVNTNDVLSDSTLNAGNGGYHGLVVESVGPTAACPGNVSQPGVCGLKIIGNTWKNTVEEAMDFEVDLASSVFSGTGCTSLPGGMCPTNAAEDNILIANNTYTAWCNPWFASIQAFGKGVQEDNLTFSGNTLNNTACPTLGVAGSVMHVELVPPCCAYLNVPPYTITAAPTPPQFWSQNWNFTHNILTGFPAHTTAPVSCFGGSPLGQTFEVSGVVNMKVTDNDIPIDTTQQNHACPGNPYLPVLQPQYNTNFQMQDNTFIGAVQILHGSSNDQNLTHCGNVIVAGASPVDGSC